MTLIASFIAALKIIAFVGLVASFIFSILLLLFWLGEGDSPCQIKILIGIPLILLWVTLVIYVMANGESWFERPWFQPNPPANVLVITPEKS
jgi:NADH:ubiquinone oxidoreductase subunit 6 (subunit J)